MKKLLAIILILTTSALIAGCRHGDQPAELKAPDGCTMEQVFEWVQEKT